MRIINRNIYEFQEDEFLLAIRDKIHYVKIILSSARLLLLNNEFKEADTQCRLKLIIDKMTRLFIIKENKFYSISFPFNVTCNNNNVIEISTYSGINVDHKNISSAFSVLNSEQFKLRPSPLDFWVDTHDSEMFGLYLLEEILLFEPAYLRYDVDPDRANGKKHPLHHIDINYSSYATYKLGLNNNLLSDEFENILNINTDCSFISF